MNKPMVLYHGSTHTDIATLEPREESPNPDIPGKFVFATPHKQIAAMFMAPKRAGPTIISQYVDVYGIIICCTPDAFHAADTGGAIYELSPSQFSYHPELGMRDAEWFCSEAVVPLRKTVYATSLAAMQETGVQLYCVDSSTYDAIQTSDDHGGNIIQALTPITG